MWFSKHTFIHTLIIPFFLIPQRHWYGVSNTIPRHDSFKLGTEVVVKFWFHWQTFLCWSLQTLDWTFNHPLCRATRLALLVVGQSALFPSMPLAKQVPAQNLVVQLKLFRVLHAWQDTYGSLRYPLINQACPHMHQMTWLLSRLWF